MKVRLCDKCKKNIEGKFIKCCESEMINKEQRLIHIGDLCLDCWDLIRGQGR